MAPRISLRRFALSLALLLVMGGALVPYPVSAARLAAASSLPDLQSFSRSVRNGAARALRGAYAAGLFALPIEQQPSSRPGFVSGTDNTATQYRLANQFGNVGLLAHNFLSGQYFSHLWRGQPIFLIYGDGRIEAYRVSHMYGYQATDPSSVFSNFIDLDTGQRLSAGDLFAKMYEGTKHVTFQTCITERGNSTWGRLFVIAEPY